MADERQSPTTSSRQFFGSLDRTLAEGQVLGVEVVTEMEEPRTNPIWPDRRRAPRKNRHCSKTTVLVVEDDRALREMYRAAFTG